MVKDVRIGEIEFIRISRDTQFHYIYNVSKLGGYHGETLHFIDLDGNDFISDDEKLFSVTNVDDSLLIESGYLILDLQRI